ncbi:MAG: antibiotic biosynthesis monooxygenase [Bacteroidetes bacterium]|nr:antibiotic biosynthesis monooxygenase [Bacteroidota bacterium]
MTKKNNIIRIVKLSFYPEKVPHFIALFEQTKEKIRNTTGCTHLELWCDANTPHVYFTYSHWEDASFLEAYKNSDLFKTTWAKTKILFNDAPQAWSVQSLMRGEPKV